MIKINMGCGKRNFGSDWVHIDGGNHEHLDFKDVTKLEFDNSSVDLIYASHLLEYFDREEVASLLEEWTRVLKPGGILRIAVPDFQAMVNLYNSGGFLLNSFLGPLYGKMDMGDKKIYHKTTYDFNSLRDVLFAAGFEDVKRYDWKGTEHSHIDDHSQAYLPHMDKESGILISLNVEGVKR